MSEPDGPDVQTSPVTHGTGRGAGVVLATVGLVVATSFLLARLSPGTEPSPSIDAVTASATAAAHRPPDAGPPATALPARDSYSAPAAPLRDVLVETDTIRWLRLASTRLTDVALARPGRDLLLQGARGGTTCLCWAPLRAAGAPAALELVRVGNDLVERSRTLITTVPGFDPGTGRSQTSVVLEPVPDGSQVALLRAGPSTDGWQVVLETIDLATATLVDSRIIVAVGSSDRSPVVGFDRPELRIAPDGRHALILVRIERERGPDPGFMMVTSLGGSGIGAPVPLPDSAHPIDDDCSWIDFASPSLIVAGCRPASAEPDTQLTVRRIDLVAGERPAIVGLPPNLPMTTPIIDRVSGIAYAWSPAAHTLLAVDLVRGGWRSAGLPGELVVNRDGTTTFAPRPAPGEPASWSVGRPATDASMERTLIGSSDGGVLFATGVGSDGRGSSGIWVFDAGTLDVLEHWPASAGYRTLTLFEGGEWLAAIGRPGQTETGAPAEWATSLTVHDTTTGRPVVRLGDLGPSGDVEFPWPKPLAVEP